ncbi:MAG TPA: oligosaccharide flippase family protein [Myxococcales bacterium]|nr:oligosaccharide flippase family protein [Myxococcales bacterium]
MQNKVSILRRASPLMAARLAIAALNFAIPMVLARVLDPTHYGTFNQAWLLANILWLVLPMGLIPSLTYFTPREPAKKAIWRSHALLITTAVGALAAIILMTLGKVVADQFHNPELHRLMPYVAAFSFFKIAGSTYDGAFMAEGRIKESALARISTEGLYSFCVVGGALYMHSLEGVFAGCVLSTFIRATACWIRGIKSGFQVSWPDLKRQLQYALPFGAASALIIPQQNFHSLLVSSTVSAAAFAVYRVGCLQLPIIDMLYTPVSEILQLGIAEHDAHDDNEGALKLFQESVAKMSFVFVPTMALLAVVAPVLIRFLYTDKYIDAVPLFRLAMISIPMAALPLDGVMRARAQRRFLFNVSVLKLGITVPFVWIGLHQFGLIGALGGWILAEESCRMLLLRRAAKLFRTNILGALPRQLWFQVVAAAISVVPALVVRRFGQGPLLAVLFECGIAFSLTYLAALRIMGVLPPVKEWIPKRKAAPAVVEEVLAEAA